MTSGIFYLLFFLCGLALGHFATMTYIAEQMKRQIESLRKLRTPLDAEFQRIINEVRGGSQ